MKNPSWRRGGRSFCRGIDQPTTQTALYFPDGFCIAGPPAKRSNVSRVVDDILLKAEDVTALTDELHDVSLALLIEQLD